MHCCDWQVLYIIRFCAFNVPVSHIPPEYTFSSTVTLGFILVHTSLGSWNTQFYKNCSLVLLPSDICYSLTIFLYILYMREIILCLSLSLWLLSFSIILSASTWEENLYSERKSICCVCFNTTYNSQNLEPKCLRTDDCIKKLRYIHIMEYHLTWL